MDEIKSLLNDITKRSDEIKKDENENREADYQNIQEYLDFDINEEEKLLIIKSQNVNKYGNIIFSESSIDIKTESK